MWQLPNFFTFFIALFLEGAPDGAGGDKSSNIDPNGLEGDDGDKGPSIDPDG